MIGGLVSLVTTSFGGALAFTASKAKEKKWWNPLRSVSLDFAIGMMVSASAFSLIGPAVESSRSAHTEWLVVSALLVGIVFIKLLGGIVARALNGGNSQAMVFLVAILLHNFPEGIAAGMGSEQILWAIGLQNIPEGLVTATSFLALGFSAPAAFAATVASGVIEMSGALLGEYYAQASQYQALFMAFAGGSMMSAALGELWERVRGANFRTYDFIFGALVILILN